MGDIERMKHGADMIEVVSAKRDGDFFFGELRCGRYGMQIAIGKERTYVLCQVTSHRARGVGRAFANPIEAVAGYKSTAMKEMIGEAIELSAKV